MAEYTFPRILWLGTLGIVVFGMSGCGKPAAHTSETASTAAAASVNGEPISLDDYYQHMGVKQTAQVMTRNGANELRVIGSFGLQTMQELVDQKILMQMAKEQGVTPTEAEIDAELKLQTELRPDYVKILEDQGLSMPMIRDTLKIGLAREHLVMKGVTVEPSEVDKFIKDHPERFREGEKASVLYIQVSSAAAKAKIDAALGSGRSFGAVAAQYSQARGAKENGGAYQTDVVADMPKPLQDVVKKTPEKGTSAWIPSGTAFFKFYVDRKTPAKPKTPTAAERELVRRGIALQKGEAKNDFDHQFFDKLRQSKVDISVPYLKDPWSKTWNQLSGPTGGPTPSGGN